VSRCDSSNELPAADRPTTQGQVSIRQLTHWEGVICLYLLLSLSDTVCLLLPLPMVLLPLPMVLLPPRAVLLLPGPGLLLWLLKGLPLPEPLPLLQSPLPPLLLQLLLPVGLLLMLPLPLLLMLPLPLLLMLPLPLLLLLLTVAILLAKAPRLPT